MNNLKTNRSVGLYIMLTILMNLLPFIFLVTVIKRVSSQISNLALDFFIGKGEDSIADLLTGMLIFIVFILLYAIVYLIYKIILFCGVCKDINTICGKYQIGKDSVHYIVVMLLSVVTLQIYEVYWSYQQGKRIREAGQAYQSPIKANEKVHLTFSLLAAASIWINVILSNLISSNPGFLLSNIFTVIFLEFAVFVLSYMGMINLAYFIKDLNTLAIAYNAQLESSSDNWKRADIEYQGQEPGNNGNSDVTVPVEEWMPDKNSAWTPERKTMPQKGFMEGYSGTYKGALIPIEGDVVVGRDETVCNVVIKEPYVSRRHCVIHYNYQNGTYVVTDYSTTGVFYQNGQAFPKNSPVICTPGTMIVIARSGNEFLLK